MATMRRCRAQLTIECGGKTEHLWAGLEVNFERELAPGFTVADAVAGREDCFEIAGEPIASSGDGPALDPDDPFEPFITETAEPGVHLPPHHEE